jgi:AcrR family transcriptional regulator
MKENRRIMITRKLLKESILELMKNRSINKISIKDICENADVNRTTFYNYYTDQYALLNEIEQDVLNKTTEFLSKLNDGNAESVLLENFLEYVKKDREIFHTLLCNDGDNSFQIKLMDISMNRLKSDAFDSNISQVEEEYVYEFVLMGCLSMIKKWVINSFDKSPTELSKLLITLVNHGISAFR